MIAPAHDAMSTHAQARAPVQLGARPVEVRTTPNTDPNVGVVIVTWNRREAVDAVLTAIRRQGYPLDRLDVAIIDNASTDGTAAFLEERWRPERRIDNPTDAADRPEFRESDRASRINAGGFRSLTIVRNAHNLGGCGGFNTGLAWVERSLDTPGRADRPDYVWLVDDDVDLPPDALRRLVDTAESDADIGIVGSRTVDFDDRSSTLETTIYFDADEGVMSPDPPIGHPMADSHAAWVARTGGTRGRLEFRGQRDVDIVSACSLLARWSAVRRVGFWDRRYFIYCDDADWCLRFRRAGYRVVCDLGAVAYHTYWLSKLTPVRGYYARRNLLWMAHKVMTRQRLRRIVPRRFAAALLESRKAATHCRLFHAEIIRRSVHDVITDRAGKLDVEGPSPVPLLEGLDSVRALRPEAEILVMCSHPDSIAWADEWRARVTHALLDAGRLTDQPRWTYMVRAGVPDPGPGTRGSGPAFNPARFCFQPNRRSKWWAQRRYIARPADAVVVFDQHNDFPLVRSRANVHVDRRTPGVVQIERDGLARRAAFFLRWAWTSLRAPIYALTVRPRTTSERYG